MSKNPEVYDYLKQRSFDLYSERMTLESILKDKSLMELMPVDKVKKLRADLKTKSTMLHVVYQLIYELEDNHPYKPSIPAQEHSNE